MGGLCSRGKPVELCPNYTRGKSSETRDPIDAEIQQQLQLRQESFLDNSSLSEGLLEDPRESNFRFLGCFSCLLTLVDACGGLDLLVSRKEMLSGCLLVVFALLPSWLYGIVDAMERRWTRFTCAICGFSGALKYSGIAASPEMGLLSSTLGALPTLMVTSAASDLNTDLLIGGKVTDVSEWLLIIVALVSGVTIAAAVCECRDSLVAPRTSWMHFSYIAAYFAVDALCVVSVIGLVGAQFSHDACFLWCLSFWICCGLVPTIYAPLHMPTLEPALPMEGVAYVFHRLGASLLMVASSPLAYAPMIRADRTKVWAVASLCRSLFLCITVAYENIDVDTDNVTITYLIFISVSLMHSIAKAIYVLCH